MSGDPKDPKKKPANPHAVAALLAMSMNPRLAPILSTPAGRRRAETWAERCHGEPCPRCRAIRSWPAQDESGRLRCRSCGHYFNPGEGLKPKKEGGEK